MLPMLSSLPPSLYPSLFVFSSLSSCSIPGTPAVSCYVLIICGSGVPLSCPIRYVRVPSVPRNTCIKAYLFIRSPASCHPGVRRYTCTITPALCHPPSHLLRVIHYHTCFVSSTITPASCHPPPHLPRAILHHTCLLPSTITSASCFSPPCLRAASPLQ